MNPVELFWRLYIAIYYALFSVKVKAFLRYSMEEEFKENLSNPNAILLLRKPCYILKKA